MGYKVVLFLLMGIFFAVSCQVAIRGESRAIRVLLECIMWLLHLFKDLKMASMMERMGISASASHLFQYREFQQIHNTQALIILLGYIVSPLHVAIGDDSPKRCLLVMAFVEKHVFLECAAVSHHNLNCFYRK